MNITTKYSLGDRVYPITLKMETETKQCEECSGRGYVLTDTGRERQCDRCYGRGELNIRSYNKYIVETGSYGVIGKVEVEFYGADNSQTKIKYMLDSTGIGSGVLWPENKIFFTKEEAQAECDKRNKEGG
jgi:hypothetical protein